MTHTPGPWFLLTDNIITSNAGQDWERHIVADARTIEDARLIAAAPDLLQACDDALNVLKGLDRIPEVGKTTEPLGSLAEYIGMVDRLGHAIAKAKGEAADSAGSSPKEYAAYLRTPEGVKAALREEEAFRRGYFDGVDHGIEAMREGVSLEQLIEFFNGPVREWRFGNMAEITPPPDMPKTKWA